MSTILHWWSMPLICYLRHSFGYSFLSPKGIFLSFVLAQFFYTIFSLLEPEVWRHSWAFTCFGTGAALLYIFHLVDAFTAQNMKIAKHDYHAGTSIFAWLFRLLNRKSRSGEFRIIPLWIEPGLAVMAAAIIWLGYKETMLSVWLCSLAASLWLKEFFNYWYKLRLAKVEDDMRSDSEDKFQNLDEIPLPSGKGRRRRVKNDQ